MAKAIPQTYHNPSKEPKRFEIPTTPEGSPYAQTVPPGAEFEAPKNYEKFFVRCGFAVGPAAASAPSAPPPSKDEDDKPEAKSGGKRK